MLRSSISRRVHQRILHSTKTGLHRVSARPAPKAPDPAATPLSERLEHKAYLPDRRNKRF